ncbi:HNH endonuclease signature motif containing protein [Microbacterium sp. YJN-G]|uniref:HNH endonuclease signature motif containing protein n=1 Tax=Microbacterium sp. YJN-G TaxID=2763257 RepID=UPI0018788F79|nr:HNH endonuclease signature motif containing protein [Microbacterium sp. YJN-G]
MNEIAMASDGQLGSLDAIVSSLEAVEQTLQGVLAARDGLLALASRVALSIAEENGGVEASDITLRNVAAELAGVLRVSDRTVQRRMADADLVVSWFPQVWAAQGAGRISAGHTRVIVDAGSHLQDPDARAAYAGRVLEFAVEESPNRLRPIAQRIAEQYQPRSLGQRHQDARATRTVWAKDADDGMAELGILGPAVLVHGVYERLTGMAKTNEKLVEPDAAGEPDERTLGQRRADIALDLLLTGAPAGHDTDDGLLAAIVPQVSITVPVATLIGAEGVDTPPAELDGRAPIDPGTARRLAGAASGWDRVLTDPITGAMLAVDRYRPTAAMRRHLKARDQRCRFPGCGMPARNSDLDHTLDAALGGATEEDNLEDLCRRHHILKHHTPWQVEQLGGGLLEWTSPLGRTYIDRPPPQNTITFTDTDPPPGAPPWDRPGITSRNRPGITPDAWANAPAELLAPF